MARVGNIVGARRALYIHDDGQVVYDQYPAIRLYVTTAEEWVEYAAIPHRNPLAGIVCPVHGDI